MGGKIKSFIFAVNNFKADDLSWVKSKDNLARFLVAVKHIYGRRTSKWPVHEKYIGVTYVLPTEKKYGWDPAFLKATKEKCK